MRYAETRRSPRVWDDQAPSYSFVTLHCSARLIDDPGELYTRACRLAERYMGPELAEQFGKRNAEPGEYLIRGAVRKVIAFDQVSS